MNGSFTKIPTRIARQIAQATLDEVKRLREQAYEIEVKKVQQRGKRRHGLFGPRVPLTLEEAKKVVDDDDVWQWGHAYRGVSSKRVAEQLLHACNLPGSESVHISIEDAYYLHIPEEIK